MPQELINNLNFKYLNFILYKQNRNNIMKNTLNIIPEEPDLVFIALNPTKEAIANKAVFSKNEAFWNLLVNANIIYPDIKKENLINRAKAVFSGKKIYSNVKLGFADLLPLVSETDSKKVKVEKGSAKKILETMENLKDAKRIALLGQKVVDSFAKDYNLKKWKEIEMSNGVKDFGIIGKIEIDSNTIEVYAMPFPVNNSIANKHKYYSILLE